MYVPVSKNNENYYSEGFAVRFYTAENTNWVGNFEPGWTGLNAVYEFDSDPYVLVIAGGICYLMNPDFKQPISIFGAGYETVLKTLDGRLILQDSILLTIFETNGTYWHTERISWDGIAELKSEGNLISGLSFDPMNENEEWVGFVVDLEKRTVKGGSYRQYELKQPVQSLHQEYNIKKPWWKIW